MYCIKCIEMYCYVCHTSALPVDKFAALNEKVSTFANTFQYTTVGSRIFVVPLSIIA